jgi:hypothetical protein
MNINSDDISSYVKRRSTVTNLATSPAYAKNPPKIEVLAPPVPAKKIKQKNKTDALSAEDEQIIIAFNTVKGDLDNLHNRYDQTTDPLMLESIIYELKAANLRFMYYLNLCKDRGIVCKTVGVGE